MGFKVLVCGSRELKNKDLIFSTLDELISKLPVDCLIHGDANGADTFAKQWALENGVQPVGCPALWDYWRSKGNLRAAGPERNKAMALLKPDFVIAFPGGAGTRNMINTAINYGIPVAECKPDSNVLEQLCSQGYLSYAYYSVE